MAKGKITQFADLASLKKQAKEFDGLLVGLEQKIENFPRIAELFKGADSLKKLTEAQKEHKKALDEMDKLQKQIVINEQKIEAQRTKEAQMVAAQKLAIREFNKEQQARIKLQQAEEGSVNKLSLQYDKAVRIINRLSEAQRNSARGQQLVKFAEDLSKRLKELDGQTGNFRRNVGNYANSLSGAFEKVRQEIERLKSQKSVLEDLSKVDPAGFATRGGPEQVDKLTRAIGELDKIQTVAFNSTGNGVQQVRQLERAYISLATSGTQSTEFLQEFKNEVGQAKDEVNDLKESIKLAASDTRQLDVLIGAAQAVAGGFAIAQGAAALAGDESAELQRTLVKLNAVMTILNGLQAIQNELKKKDNILTIAQTNLQRLYAFAVGSSTGAMKAFRVALASTGVGLAIIAIGVLVSKLMQISASAKAANLDLELLTNTLDDLSFSSSRDIKNAQRENELLIASLKARGASEQEIQAAKIEGLQTELNWRKRLNIQVTGEYNNSRASLITIKNEKQAVEELRITRAKLAELNTGESEAAKKLYQARIDGLEKVVASYDGIREAEQQLAIEQQNANAQVLENYNKEKAAALELFKFRQQLFIDQKNLEAGDDSILTLNGRVTAARSAADAQKEIVLRQAAFELSQSGLTASQVVLIQEKKAEDIQNIERALQTQLLQIRINYIEKIRELENESIQQFQEDEVNRVQAQLNAAQSSYNKQNDLIEQNRQEQISGLNRALEQEQITIEQYQANKELIELQSNRKRLTATVDFYKAQLDILKRSGQDTAAMEQSLNDARKALWESDIATVEATSQKIYDIRKEAIDKEKELLENLGDRIQTTYETAINGVFDRQKNRIQEQIDLIDEWKAKEIDRINATGESEEKKAARIKIIEAKAQAEREVLQRRQRQIERQKAIFEKALKATEIIQEGIKSTGQIKLAASVAGAKAFAATLNPVISAAAYASVAALIPKVAADTALQLVALLATAIPQFYKGTDNAPEGLALWGERGQELKIDKHGRMELSPSSASLVYLQGGEKIYPADVTRDILNSMSADDLSKVVIVRDKSTTITGINDLVNISRQIANNTKEKSNTYINIHNDAAFQAYIDFNVRR